MQEQRWLPPVVAGDHGAQADDCCKVAIVLDFFTYFDHKVKTAGQLMHEFKAFLRLYLLSIYSRQLNLTERLWRHYRHN